MPNPLDTRGQHVQQEATNEFNADQAPCALAPMIVSSNGKDHIAGRDHRDALIADGGVVRAMTEEFQRLRRNSSLWRCGQATSPHCGSMTLLGRPKD